MSLAAQLGNGGSRASVPPASLRAPMSPLDAAPPSSGRAQTWAVAGTLLVHLGVVLLVAFASVRHAHAPSPPVPVTELVEVELPPKPAPPKVAEPPPPVPVAPPQPRPIVHTVKPPPPPKPVEAPHPKAAPPPAAAQAGKVLAAEPTPKAPAPPETIQTGQAQTFAGGTTASDGTATHAVTDPNARAGGVEGGTGTDPHGDLSRAPALAGGASWDCPFPPEADDEGIDHAVVTLQVEVGPDGRATAAEAKKDPGSGFGREARRCALRQRWSPGLDRAGQPYAASALVNVRFDR